MACSRSETIHRLLAQAVEGGYRPVAFQGSRVTSDAGLILVRELDERYNADRGRQSAMNDIVAFSFGRKQSTRVPNKMLRPFAGTTLVDVALRKLRAVDPCAFFAGFEEEFKIKCSAHGVRFVQRDEKSIGIDGPISEILSFLRSVDAKYLLLISACSPFMTVEHIKDFRARCVAGGYRPAISVKRHRKHFVAAGGAALNFDRGTKTLNTKTVEPVFELVDGLYFFEKDFFFTHGTYWRWNEVQFLEVGGDDLLIDVDTETDFAAAESLWAAGHGH